MTDLPAERKLPPVMNARWKRNLQLVSLLGAFTVFTVTSYYAYRSNYNVIAVNRGLLATNRIIDNLQDLLSLLRHMESAARGFALTGRPQQRAVYEKDLPEIERLLQSLQNQPMPSARARQHLETLLKRASEKLVWAREEVDVRQKSGMAAVQGLHRERRGEDPMAELDSAFKELREETGSLFEQQLQNEEASWQDSKFWFVIRTVVVIVLLLLVYLFLYWEIHERKRTEKDLRRAQSQLGAEKQALDQYAIVAETDAEGRLTYVNDMLTRISQYSREELLGQNARILNSGYYPNSFWEVLWKTISSGRNWHGELRNKAKDGSYYWVHSIVVPFPGPDGKPERYLSIQVPITELKEAEKELKAATEAAEAAGRAKADFLANMSHEIRTPMNAVIGMVQLLRGTELTPKQKEFADIACQAGDSLVGLINDILDFSKIEAGKLKIESMEFDPRATVHSVIEMLSGQAHAKDLLISAEISHDVPERLVGDPLRLRQVLINLVSNAIKFSDKGGVRVTVTRPDETASQARLQFEIQDTGIGMNPETQAKLFQAFSQGDTSVTRKYGGTGLGLAISRQLVGLMGGKIGVRSQPGQGSTFWFAVDFPKPAVRPEGPLVPGGAAREMLSCSLNAQDLSLLVVEDNRFNQVLMQNLLANLGYRADVVSTGQKALAALGDPTQHYDAVLMDCQMPEMDGYQAAAAIRALGGTVAKIPIIALTAHALEGDREECLAAGMNDYLAKPIDPQRLREVLSRWVRGFGEREGAKAEAPAPPKGKDPVDMSILLTTTEGNQAGLVHLITLYLAQSRESMTKLEQAIEGGVPEEIRRAAHGLNGSSACFGATRIIQPLQEIEQMAKKGQIEPRVKTLLAQAQEDFRQIEAFVEHYLHPR